MARKKRLHVPGGYYHVMLRGNGGQDIFIIDQDIPLTHLPTAEA